MSEAGWSSFNACGARPRQVLKPQNRAKISFFEDKSAFFAQKSPASGRFACKAAGGVAGKTGFIFVRNIKCVLPLVVAAAAASPFRYFSRQAVQSPTLYRGVIWVTKL